MRQFDFAFQNVQGVKIAAVLVGSPPSNKLEGNHTINVLHRRLFPNADGVVLVHAEGPRFLYWGDQKLVELLWSVPTKELQWQLGEVEEGPGDLIGEVAEHVVEEFLKHTMPHLRLLRSRRH
jgi:hypothetical protein